MKRRAWAVTALLAGFLGACTLGPNFREPDAPRVPAANPYTPEPMAAQTASAPGPGGAAQRFVPGDDIPAQWWSLFHSEPLDRLIRSALCNSPTLASAQAALRQAQESYRAEAGSLLFPAVSGLGSATRERGSFGTSEPSVFNLYNASVNVSYNVDAFGATRRDLEAVWATVDYQRFQLEAAYLALTANVVTSAIQEASLRAQLQTTSEVLALQEKSLAVIEKQAALGAVARPAVLAQRTQVAQTRATLPALEKALAQTHHQLAVYAGRFPSEPGLPEFQLESLQLPQELPLSLPSSLVRQRPDIRANEALWHEASARIGVATASLFPQLNLSGSLGFQAFEIGNLLSSSARIWSIGAALSIPIFNGGALQARRRGAIAAYEQAGEQYRATVLAAFQNVADVLRALDTDAAALRAQADAEAAARESLELVSRQYEVGASSYLALLDAQRTHQQSRLSLVQAEAARYADTAALFQALGGGWWNRADLDGKADRAAQN
ncbi:MAG: efflux transporter outer membrane subunit [Sulfuricella sp.]